MIDFVKFNLLGIAPEHLEQNPLLDFYNKVNTKTGQLGKYLNAYYKGLEFRIFERTTANPEQRITVEGSLHKYWNNGAHNFNDFGINEINEVVKDLNNKFGITSINCVLKQLEIGVNINTPLKTKTLLKQCLLHKTDRLKWIFTKDEGNYIQAQHQRYILKIYDKRTHYKNKGFPVGKDEIMRIEVKYRKMIDLNAKGIYNLQDLLNYGLGKFTPVLLKHWQDVIFYDFKALEGTQYENTYSNPNYWENLNYESLKTNRNNLKKITKEHPENVKYKIAELIKQKADFLNSENTEINPLHIRLITGVSTPGNNDPNRQFCKVTGFNISMQKDSQMLSHTGLYYYYKTDRKIFDEVKRKYLSNKWLKADHKTQIKQIAKNIRHTKTNQERKQERLYTPGQPLLFELQPV